MGEDWFHSDIPWRPSPVLGDAGDLESLISRTRLGDTAGHRCSQPHEVRDGLKGGTGAGAAQKKGGWLYLGKNAGGLLGRGNVGGEPWRSGVRE